MQYLTINNITKICDNNIYLDLDGNPTNLQWYDDQIYLAIKNMKEYSFSEKELRHPITGYKLSRTQIYELLRSKNLLNFNTTNISDKELRDNGLKKGAGTKDTYKCDTLGGITNIIYNKDTSKIKLGKFKFTDKTINTINDTCYNLPMDKSQSPPKTKLPKRKLIIKPKKALAKDSVKSKKIIPSFPVNSQRKALGELAIQTSDDICRKLGKFDWKGNSCYADSILLGMLYSSILNKTTPTNRLGSLIYEVINNHTYTIENLNPDITNCSGKNRQETVTILNTILQYLRNILSKIESGEIINLKKFNLDIKNNCQNLFSENFSDNNMHDTLDYYNNIINILGLSVSSSSRLTNIIYGYETVQENLELFSASNFITTNYGPETHLTQNGLGENIYLSKTNSINPPVNIFNKLIDSDILYSKYKDIRLNNVSDLERSANPSKYLYSKELNRYYPKSQNIKYKGELAKITYNLEELLVTRYLDNFLSDKVYITNDDNYKYKNIGDETVFFKKEDEDDPSKYIDISNAPEGLFKRIGIKVVEEVTDNNSNYINFSLDRKHLTSLNRGRIINLNCKIIPPEILSVNGVDYNLDFIVLFYDGHYVNIYRCNNSYYLYNDLLASRDDYVLPIGNYEQLLSFKYLRYSQFALRNSVFISYSK